MQPCDSRNSGHGRRGSIRGPIFEGSGAVTLCTVASETGIGACLLRDRPDLVASARGRKVRWRFRRSEPQERGPHHALEVPEEFDQTTHVSEPRLVMAS